MNALVDGYDAALFDLDGVIYLGDAAVPAAPATLADLRRRGTACGFVTNNASRTPDTVADHLRRLGIAAQTTDVITSAQAVAGMLSARWPAGTPVLVLGAEALRSEVVAAGMRLVDSADDGPSVVVQGLDPAMTWGQLCDAAVAVQRGAVWVAANTDLTRPTERGLLPGCGAAVAALGLTVSVEPLVAGKPYPPLMQETLGRLGSQRPVFVGDRLDTDIAGATGVGIDSLFVLSGAHGPADLLTAPPSWRPTHLGPDVAALLDPARVVEVGRTSARCGAHQVHWTDGDYRWTPEQVVDRSGALDLIWATVRLHWSRADTGAAGAEGSSGERSIVEGTARRLTELLARFTTTDTKEQR